MFKKSLKIPSHSGQARKKEHLPIIKEDEIDFLALFRILLNGKWLIIATSGVFTVCAVIYALTLTPLYLARVSMYSISSGASDLAGLTGVAANLGISLGSAGEDFYIPDIVRSRLLKTSLIYHEWKTKKFNEPTDLINYWEIGQGGSITLNPLKLLRSLMQGTSADEQQKAIAYEEDALEILGDRISVSRDPMGLVTVNVWMEEPELAADVGNQIYEEVVKYIVYAKTNQARFNREFIERRLEEVEQELLRAEMSLTEFRESNRAIEESPRLLMEYQRINREVLIQTQVFSTLQQQYEIAKIEEVKETPTVAILDHAFPPAKKDKPRRKRMVMLAFFLGASLGVSVLYIHNYIRGLSARQEIANA